MSHVAEEEAVARSLGMFGLLEPYAGPGYELRPRPFHSQPDRGEDE